MAKNRISVDSYELGEALSLDEVYALGVADDEDRTRVLLEKKYEQFAADNPEKVGRDLWDYARLGLDKDVTERSVLGAAEFHRRKALEEKGSPDWDFVVKTSPVTAGFFANDDVMRSANDDVFALAEKEKELRRTRAVINRLNSVRGKRGRAAKVKAVTSLPENGFLKDSKGIFERTADAIRESSVARGLEAGKEMTDVAREAVALQASSGSGSGGYGSFVEAEKKWIDLEGRLFNLDSERPDGFFSGMLYETGKVIGQQLGTGSYRTTAMAATGASLAAYAGGAAAGVIGAPVAAGLTLTAAAGWALGAKLGVFVNSAETEGGLDLISRHFMAGKDGQRLSDAEVSLGSAAVGIANGLLESVQWSLAGKPFSGVVKKAIANDTMKAISAKITERAADLPAARAVAEGIGSSVGRLSALADKLPQREVMARIAKDWITTNAEESFTEVLQELAPITIDEMQKAGLLDGYDMRSVEDITSQLADTFVSSFYSFALMSAAGPVMGGLSGRYRVEAYRKAVDAMETRRMNRSMEAFAQKMGATKLFRRFPAMSDAHTEMLLDGADLSKVYIGADKMQTLFQSGALGAEGYDSAAGWAQDVFGVAEEDFNRSLEFGNDVEIEAIKLFNSIEGADGEANTALYDAVKDDIRFAPDGMTMREASEHYKGIKDLQARDLLNVTAGIGEDAKRAESAAKVTEALRIQLTEAGQDAELAAANAAIGGQIYARLADAYQYALPASERKNMFVYAEDVMKKTPLIIERDEQGKVTSIGGQSNVLFSPINAGVNINKMVMGTVVNSNITSNEIEAAKKNGGFVNKITGMYRNSAEDWNIYISKKNVAHAINSAINGAARGDVADFKTSMCILRDLPHIIERAVLIESHKDRKHNDQNVKAIHRMYAPVRVTGDNAVYVVKITVKELIDKYEATVEGIYRGYDTKVDSKTSIVGGDVLTDNGSRRVSNNPTMDVFEISIHDMLQNSKDNNGRNFFQIKRKYDTLSGIDSHNLTPIQNEPDTARGSISLPVGLGSPVHITLGKDANASTFVHELGHFYLWNLRQMAKSDVIANRADWMGPDARWNMDLKTVAQWWRESADVIATEAALYANGEGVSADGFRAWLDAGMETGTETGAAYDRAAQEYFARGFEAYLFEGRAPSGELTGVFRRFKRWLCEIYRAITELNVELSDDVRSLFDRMLASEDAIARHKINERLNLEVAASAEAMTEDEAESFAAGAEDLDLIFPDYDPYEAAKEDLLKELLAGTDDETRHKAMTVRAEELRPQVYFEVTSEPGYKALEIMGEMPELKLNEEAVVDTFGDTIAAVMPRGAMSEDGITDLNIAAKSLGFNSAQEMIDAIAGRNELADEVDARVKALVQAEFAEHEDMAEMDDRAEEAIHADDNMADEVEARGLSGDEALELVEGAAEVAHEEFLTESEFADVFINDDATAAPVSLRTEAVRRLMAADTRLSYRAVLAEHGRDAADDLKGRYGVGIFSKDGMTLDDFAVTISKDGVPVADGREALDFLLAPATAEELAYEESRAEVLERYGDEFKRLKREIAARVKKSQKKNVKAVFRERYKALADKVRADYKERAEKLKDKYAERRARLDAKAAEDRQRVKELEARLRNKFEEKRRFRAFAEALAQSAERKKRSMQSEANSKTAKGGAKLAAVNTVAAMSVNELYDVTGWLRVEKDSQAAALNCLRNMDEDGFRHNWSKYLHAFFIVREMYRERGNVEFMRSRLLRWQGRGKRTFGMSPEFCYQMDKMLARFDFGKRSVGEHKDLSQADMYVGEAASLSDFIAEQAADGVPLLIPDWIVQSPDVRMIDALSLQQMKDLYNAAVNLEHVGREDKRTTAREKNVELAAVEGEVLARAQEYFGADKVHGRTNIETARSDPNRLLEFLHTLETAEAMCRTLDGFQDFGPMQDYVFRPIREGVSVEDAELKRVFSEFRDLKARTVGANYKLDTQKRDIGVREYERITDPQTGKAAHVPNENKSLFDREMLIAAALNMGNEGNIARLHDGWGWSEAEMEAIRDQLTKDEWDYVQGVWDLLDSLWPQIKKVHEMMTGTTIERVETKPFVTKYGQTMRGGYYPIVTDLRYSVQAAAQAEREEVMASAGPLAAASKAAKSGHRKARADNVIGRPPLLSLSVLDNHVANVIHDYTMSPVIRDARKILRRDVVRSVVKSVYGDQGNKIFNSWLNDVAANTRNNGVALSPVDKFVNGVRANTAMFALGANVGGALMQPLGYFPLAHRIGFVKTASAILNGLLHPRETYEFARTHSAFMREQMESGGSSEIKKIRQNWSVGGRGVSGAADFFLSIYPLLQNMCNVPGWVQCYKDGISSGLSDKDAVRRADAIIRQTQSASTIADLASVERSGALPGLVTMFYSWFRVMWNMQTEALTRVRYEQGVDKVRDIASYAFYVLVCQSVAEALLRGNGPDPDDEDEFKWAKWTARKLFTAPLMPIPGAREVAGFIDNDMKYSMRVSPAQSALESVERLVRTAYKQYKRADEGDDVEWPKLAEAGATVFGYAKGVPNRKLIQAAMAFWEYFDEGKAIPWAYLILGSGYKK